MSNGDYDDRFESVHDVLARHLSELGVVGDLRAAAVEIWEDVNRHFSEGPLPRQTDR